MIRITEPVHGAVLNRLHGEPRDGGLEIAVRGTAPRGHAVAVNGAPARRAGEEFRADVLLRDAETDVVAAAGGTGGTAEHRIRVVWDRASFPRYRFSIDDNSFFLRDVASRRYRSLFDCPYLGALKDLNTRFGAKFVLNLFYSTPESDFSLDRFPADYRAEWADAAGWLERTEQGGSIEAGTIVPTIDRRTRKEKLVELDEDLDYSRSQVDRAVTVKSQIRLVLETFRDRLFTGFFPGTPLLAQLSKRLPSPTKKKKRSLRTRLLPKLGVSSHRRAMHTKY